MLRLAAPVLVFLTIAAPARSESPSNEAKTLLERMVSASRSMDYEGTFVYVQGQNIEAMHIVHSSKGGERQRLSSLNGSVREVLIVEDTVVCVLPSGTQSFVVDSGFKRSLLPIALPKELDRLEAHYELKVLGKDRTAGIVTRVVAIEPRDAYRFGYKLWLDSQTGMVLRSALVDGEHKILEQLMFTSIQVEPDIDEQRLQPPNSSEAELKSSTHPTGEAVTDSDWSITKLPPGFVQLLHNRYTKALAHHTEHIVLTDGLATVSVFVEKLDGSEPLLEGASRMGAMNAYGVLLADHQVMVVGEVPSAAVEMIATSLEYHGGDSAE
jgi:sigma-E factor negative regulatory protein RseB